MLQKSIKQHKGDPSFLLHRQRQMKQEMLAITGSAPSMGSIRDSRVVVSLDDGILLEVKPDILQMQMAEIEQNHAELVESAY